MFHAAEPIFVPSTFTELKAPNSIITKAAILFLGSDAGRLTTRISHTECEDIRICKAAS